MPKKTPKLTDYPASLHTPEVEKALSGGDEGGGWCNTAAMLTSLVILTIIVVFIVVMVWYWNKPKAGDGKVKEVRFASDAGIKECSQTEFQKIVSPTAGSDALVVFVAEWCGFCKKMKPDLHEASKMANVPIYTVTFDEKQPWIQQTMQQLGIQGFPALVLFRQGQKPKMAAGYRAKDEILKFIET
jgi:thiol-disulfide isomerase/thioredoxin